MKSMLQSEYMINREFNFHPCPAYSALLECKQHKPTDLLPLVSQYRHVRMLELDPRERGSRKLILSLLLFVRCILDKVSCSLDWLKDEV